MNALHLLKRHEQKPASAEVLDTQDMIHITVLSQQLQDADRLEKYKILEMIFLKSKFDGMGGTTEVLKEKFRNPDGSGDRKVLWV